MIDFLMTLGLAVLSLIGLVSIFILGIFLAYLVVCVVKYKGLIFGKEEESKEESEEESKENEEESKENKNMVNKEDLDFKE